jgi:antirestriction protein
MLKIYLTDLASYNKGYLYGEWISLPCNSLQDKLDKLLKASEALCFIEEGYYEIHEEYFITDYEWEDVDLFEVGEYENIFELNNNLELLNDCSNYQLKAVKYLLDETIAKNIADALNKVDDVIIYENQTMKDLAYDLIHELYSIDTLPSILANNIDYDGVARDLEMDGRYSEIDDDIYEYVN